MTTLDLRTLKLRSGEQFLDEREVQLEPLELGGQRYLPVPETAEQQEWIRGLTRWLEPPLTAAQRQELDRRLADMESNPGHESDWEDMIARLRERPA